MVSLGYKHILYKDGLTLILGWESVLFWVDLCQKMGASRLQPAWPCASGEAYIQHHLYSLWKVICNSILLPKM